MLPRGVNAVAGGLIAVSIVVLGLLVHGGEKPAHRTDVDKPVRRQPVPLQARIVYVDGFCSRLRCSRRHRFQRGGRAFYPPM